MKRLEIINKQFGRLTVLEEIAGQKVFCKCSCGKNAILIRDNVITGNTKSCGCLKSENGKMRALEMQKFHTLPFGEGAFRETYRNYKYNASKRGRAFILTTKEALHLFTGECFYCGAQPSNITIGKNGDFIYSGIDRKNNLEGYSAENCVSCCQQCNWAKRDLPMSDYIKWLADCFSKLNP